MERIFEKKEGRKKGERREKGEGKEEGRTIDANKGVGLSVVLFTVVYSNVIFVFEKMYRLIEIACQQLTVSLFFSVLLERF